MRRPAALFALALGVSAAGPAVPQAQPRPIPQALLADRFNLAVHAESPALPAYALVLARDDGYLGDQLRPSSVECARPAQAAAGNAGGPGAVLCGPWPGGPGTLSLVGSPISQLASLLALMPQRAVIDKTGQPGRSDVELSYAPPVPAPGDAILAPSLFTALQEPRGLKLEAGEKHRWRCSSSIASIH